MIGSAILFAGVGAAAMWADRSEQRSSSTPYSGVPSLPPLPFPEDALEPWSSAESVRLHHDTLQAAYVTKTGEALRRLEEGSRGEASDVRARRRFGANMSLVSNAAGAMLHQLFWENLSRGKTRVPGFLARAIRRDFGSVERLEEQVEDLASLLVGSGWIVLAYSPYLGRMVVFPVFKHQNNWIPGSVPLMVLDLWEHAYYLDHPADKMAYVRGFWDHVNWPVVDLRLRHQVGAG